MNNNSSRIESLDKVRAIALLMIVLNHSISTFYIDQLNFGLFNEIALTSKIFMLFSFMISRLGVPLFLLLTGALILKKDFSDSKSIHTFYKTNLLSLVVCVCIWNIIYYFINMCITGAEFSISDFIQILLFMKNSVYGHMWYMPMIIGMYIFLPYISIIIKKIEIRKLLLPLIIILISFCVLPYLSKVFSIFQINIASSPVINLTFSGAQYGLYIILGYYIFNKNFLKNLKPVLSIAIAIFAFLLSVLLQYFFYINNVNNLIVYYNFIGILVFSILIFKLIIYNWPKSNKFFNYLSIRSLGIFFIHFPLLIILDKLIKINVSRPLNVLIFYLLSLLLSIILIELLKFIKPIKKYLFRLK